MNRNKTLVVGITIYFALILTLVACGSSSVGQTGISAEPTLPATARAFDTKSTILAPTVITNVPNQSPEIKAPALPLSPVRLVLEAENLSHRIEGKLEPPTSDSYLFQGLGGQELTVELDSPGSQVNFELVGLKNGVALKRLVDEDRRWAGVLPLTQEYRLDIAALPDNGNNEYSYVLVLAISEHQQDNFVSEPPPISPDGLWQAISEISPPEPVTDDEMDQFPTGLKYHVEMVVHRLDGSQSWTVIDEWRSWGMGYTYPEVLAWSGDGHTLFFTNVPVPDGCAPFINGGDLWQIDLNSGLISEVLPFVGLSMALSPDERRLAYFGAYGKGMTMLDLVSMQEQAIDLPYKGDGWGLGDLTWSSDGRFLILTQVYNICMPNPSTTVVRVDPQSLDATDVVELGEGYFRIIRWYTHEMILLLSPDSSEFTLNIFTGEKLPVNSAQDS